jgi:hypothetical protein
VQAARGRRMARWTSRWIVFILDSRGDFYILPIEKGGSSEEPPSTRATGCIIESLIVRSALIL